MPTQTGSYDFSAAKDAATDAANAQTTANTANSTANAANATEEALFYASASTAAPSKPTSAVTASASAYNLWRTALPTYSATYPYLYTCMQRRTSAGTYSWTAVQQSSYAAWTAAVDTKADNAARVATDYITDVTSDGIFVHTEDGSDDPTDSDAYGVHISEQVDIVRAGTVTAQFGAGTNGDEVVLGDEAESHMELDYHSMKMVDMEGNAYLYVSDLRDRTGTYEVTEELEVVAGGLLSSPYYYAYTSYHVVELLSVYDSDDELVDPAHYTLGGSMIRIEKNSSGISPGDIITVTYITDSNSLKAFTLGTRASGSEIGPYSYAFGYSVNAAAPAGHAEGAYTAAIGGQGSHAEGYSTTASGINPRFGGGGSHAEGIYSTACGWGSHAEGYETTAGNGTYMFDAWYSHAEGYKTTASGTSSHAEGGSTTARGASSHAEGGSTTASGANSHAEGGSTTASGDHSHAEGYETTASGDYSHAQNIYTKAAKTAQTALGTYNEEDTATTTTHPSGTADYGKYAVIVGNGTSDSARSNALAVDWAGNVEAAGGIKATGGVYGCKILGNRYDSRPTTPDVDDGDGTLRYFLATSSMTTNKPVTDGSIIQLNWDNSSGWSSQLFVSNLTANPAIAIRSHQGGAWSAWKYFMPMAGGTMEDGAGISNVNNIELAPSTSSAGNGGCIDFHYNRSTADYTSRIIEDSSGLRANRQGSSAVMPLSYAYNPGNIYTLASGVTMNSWTCRVYGRVVQMYATVKPTTTMAANATLFTINTPYRPLITTYFTTNASSYFGYIDADGTVHVRSALSSGVTLGISATWIY